MRRDGNNFRHLIQESQPPWEKCIRHFGDTDHKTLSAAGKNAIIRAKIRNPFLSSRRSPDCNGSVRHHCTGRVRGNFSNFRHLVEKFPPSGPQGVKHHSGCFRHLAGDFRLRHLAGNFRHRLSGLVRGISAIWLRDFRHLGVGGWLGCSCGTASQHDNNCMATRRLAKKHHPH